MSEIEQQNPAEAIERRDTKTPDFLECVKTNISLTYRDKEALETYVANKTVQQLLKDSETLALARENFTGEYQRIIENFLNEKLGKLDPEEDHTLFQFFSVIKRQFLPQIITHARKLRAEKKERDNSIRLENIINEWKQHFEKREQYKALNTNPRIPQRSNQTIIGIRAYTQKQTPTIVTEQTPKPDHNLKPKPETTPKNTPPTKQAKTLSATPTISTNETTPETLPATPETPTEPKTPEPTPPKISFRKRNSTIYGMPIIDPTNPPKKPEPMPEPTPTPQPEQPQTFVKKNFPTVPGVPEKESTDVHPIIEEPDDQWEKSLSTRDKQDVRMYRNPGLTISQIYTLSRERSYGAAPTKTDWEITLRNFHTVMIKEFENLKKEILNAETSDRPFNENLQQKMLSFLTNALRKAGSPQFRKTVIHAFYDIFKEVKTPKTREKMMQMLKLALTEREEFKKPIKPSEKMQRIHRQCELKAPKKASVEAFVKAFSEFKEEDLTDLPQDVKASMKSLLKTAQKLGINTMPMSGTATKSLASMTNEDFEMMCYQTLNQLRIISERIGGKLNPSTWRGPRKKARQIMGKLKDVIQQEIIILEHLLYSQTLFIPEEVQRLNRPNNPQS